ncbi:MAG: RHS repeat-associated core domain-containing protein [Aureispira sp.]
MCNYTPFGWNIPSRSVTNGKSYRFSFNGVEQDEEWHGGQSMAFEFRTEDPRIGRFLSPDPFMGLFAHQTPYAFADNSPIEKVDVLGLYGGKRKAKKYARENGLDPGSVYKDKNGEWRIDHSVITTVRDAKGNVTGAEGYVESKSFGKSDWASFWSSAGTRGMGLLQAGGGLIEMAGAATLLVAPEPTLTKVGAAVVGAKGIDDFATGLSQAFSGAPQQTLTYQGVKRLTGSEGTAIAADVGTSLSGIALTSSKTVTKLVTSPNVQRSVAAQVVKKAGCFVSGTIVITADSSVVIDSVQLGQLVAVSLTHSENPLDFDLLASTELLEKLRRTPIIEGEWKKLRLELSKANSDRTLIELLRPNSWIEENLRKSDSTVYVSLPEMGSVGDAKVLSIDSCSIQVYNPCSSLRPVTGKFIHLSNMVWELTFKGMQEPLGVTSNHPIWSNDRERWVDAGALEIGEWVTTQLGTTQLLSKQYLEGEHKVYNIEIHDAHNYFVSQQEILVHNTGPICPGGLKGLIPTEAGAQSASKISSMVSKLKGAKTQSEFNSMLYDMTNYSYPKVIKNPLDNNTYIIDGHHRIKAAIEANTSFDVPVEYLKLEETPFSSFEELLQLNR